MECKYYMDFKRTDWQTWTGKVDSYITRNLPLGQHEATQIVDILHVAIENANKCIPKKIISKHSKPFWTPSLTTLAKQLQQASHRVRQRGTPRNIASLKGIKAEFKATITSEKNKWIRQKLNNVNVSDCSRFWKSFKNLFGDTFSNHIGNLFYENKLYTEDLEKEEILFTPFLVGNISRRSHLMRNLLKA